LCGKEGKKEKKCRPLEVWYDEIVRKSSMHVVGKNGYFEKLKEKSKRDVKMERRKKMNIAFANSSSFKKGKEIQKEKKQNLVECTSMIP